MDSELSETTRELSGQHRPFLATDASFRLPARNPAADCAIRCYAAYLRHELSRLFGWFHEVERKDERELEISETSIQSHLLVLLPRSLKYSLPRFPAAFLSYLAQIRLLASDTDSQPTLATEPLHNGTYFYDNTHQRPINGGLFCTPNSKRHMVIIITRSRCMKTIMDGMCLQLDICEVGLMHLAWAIIPGFVEGLLESTPLFCSPKFMSIWSQSPKSRSWDDSPVKKKDSDGPPRHIYLKTRATLSPAARQRRALKDACYAAETRAILHAKRQLDQEAQEAAMLSSACTHIIWHAGRRSSRPKPLTEEDLYLDDEHPPAVGGRLHQMCSICHCLMSHPVSYECGHSNCYVCVRVWLEGEWTCPLAGCESVMHRPPFQHKGEEVSIRLDNPEWFDKSKVDYSWEGLRFPRRGKAPAPAEDDFF
ncbi:hypothetical protein B0H13DRAFT_1928233 [Mycena leptocephala]|nr:hypothetical protein B0H13DRAFT_1928233 [Mycena leptocephala]